MSKIITDPSQMVSYYEELLEGREFAFFEELHNGDWWIKSVKFQMRVGLHMGHPTQVIIANGQFIKVRPWGYDDDYYFARPLHKIDASDPDECLYGSSWHPAHEEDEGEPWFEDDRDEEFPMVIKPVRIKKK